MRKYRATIQAIEITPQLREQRGEGLPDWARRALRWPEDSICPDAMVLDTPNGEVPVANWDYLIHDGNGTLYMCDRKMFNSLFKPAQE